MEADEGANYAMSASLFKIQLFDGVRRTEDNTIASDDAALKNVGAILDDNQVRTTNECISIRGRVNKHCSREQTKERADAQCLIM